MPKVTVIIPVYEVEKYIERCARSLFEQTLDDLEFIFVDDCTKDSSISILQDVLNNYPNRREQTTIIHHEVNKGLPAARQTGIRVAKGEFVAHCDSDDWVSTDMYKSMYEKAKSENTDIVVCDFIRSNSTSNGKYYVGSSGDTSSLIREFLTLKSTAAVWNKLVKRNLYVENPILYPKWNMGEDFALVLQLIYYAKDRISYLKEPLYYYFDNSESITRNPTEASIVNKFNQVVGNIRDIEPFMIEKGLKAQYKTEWSYYKHIQRNTISALIYQPRYRRIWRETFKEVNVQMLTSRYLTIRQRVNLLLTYLGLRVGV